MKRSLLKAIFLLLFLINITNADNKSNKKLNSSTINIIYDSVYEVVLKKPFDNPYTKKRKEEENRKNEIREDSIVYEQELPWDILPYAEKVDEYYSIGTAFAISENTFLSAAHVLNLDKKILWEELYIRDKDGNVNELDQIIKYSNYRDFVIFTTKKNTSSKHLKINSNYQLNSKVFAVGNAFGEGIVIRDGLLTSTTKEIENGKWDWLRFSAAASPGNSGGPLLNESGEIIGVVLRKSQDENLNYALPISEVLKAKDNFALHHKFLNYNLLVTTKKYGPEKYDREIPLPMHYKEFRKENVKINNDFSNYMLNKLLEKYNDKIFPNGTGSYKLLHLTSPIYYPHIIAENEDDGIWDIYRPKEIQHTQLENNGYLKYGGLGSLGVFELKIPDNMSLADMINDTKLFIDTFLKGYTINRTFGDQEIRIISLGNASEREEHIDKYNRKWIIEKWLLEFANSKLLIISLPTPLGRIGFFYLGDADLIDNDINLHLKEYTNFLYYTYNGTFKQWKDFLKLDDYLPDVFKTYDFTYDDNSMDFSSNRFSISYTPDFFKISNESYLALKTAYFKENNQVVWGLSGLSIEENKNDKNYFSLVRDTKPEDELPEDFHDAWNDLVYRKFPYNREVQIDNGNTYITDIQRNYVDLDANIRKNMNKIYSIWLSMEGNVEKEKILNKFELIDSSITILESGPVPMKESKIKEGKLRH